MLIYLELFGRYFSICIGHNTHRFQQTCWFSVTEEYFDNPSNIHEVTYATSILTLGESL